MKKIEGGEGGEGREVGFFGRLTKRVPVKGVLVNGVPIGVPVVEGARVKVVPKVVPKGAPVKVVPKGAPITEEVRVPVTEELKKGVKPNIVPENKGDPKTVEPLNCPDIGELKAKLKKIGITSFENKAEEKTATTTEMQTYDRDAKRILLVENAVRLLHFAGCAVPLVSSVAEVTLALVTGLSNFNQSKALTYLASKCLSYVAHISKNLSRMLAFYQTDIVKNNNIVMDDKLYGELQKNLYTFFYFLIDSIKFKITYDVGPQHYSYWYTFLSKVDFSSESNYDEPIPTDKYRYSCKACIPKEAFREKMRTKLDKKLVTLDTPSQSTKNKTDAFLGFCSESALMICKNYNDNIMRLIELNMYILIRSAHKYHYRIHILRYTEKDASNEFFKAVFSNTLISQTEKERYIANFKNKESSQFKSNSGVAIRSFDHPDLTLTFNFLIELNRIISELKYPINAGEDLRTSRFREDYIKFPIKPVTYFFSDSKIQYEELLREYTLMIGNFLMMTSNFTLDINKLGVVDREQVHIILAKKLKLIGPAINLINKELYYRAAEVERVADKLPEDATGDGADTGNKSANHNEKPEHEGGRSLSKKKYKYFQKCKTRRNKRKRRAF